MIRIYTSSIFARKCEVVEIDGDNVKVTLTINKSRLYPNGDN